MVKTHTDMLNKAEVQKELLNFLLKIVYRFPKIVAGTTFLLHPVVCIHISYSRYILRS